MLKHSLLRLIVIVCPAIVASGYIVYTIKEILIRHGIEVNNFIYEIFLCLTMYGVAYWAGKPLFDDIRKKSAEKRRRKTK